MFFTLIFACFFATKVNAQRRCVVIDRQTGEPIPYASLYTKQGKMRSVLTDVDGKALIDFDFRRITVSHLNYNTLTLTVLPDTIRMQPKAYMTAEVVISNAEPAWIRPLLLRFVKEKEQRYYRRDTVEYDYTTQSIGTNSFYQFQSQGFILTSSPDNDNRFAFRQTRGLITAADTSRLTDYTTMRRMLYEDFVREMNRAFVKHHRFYINDENSDLKANEVDLIFRSTKYKNDRGHIIIDTARCVIRRVTRTMGIDFNTHSRVSPINLSMARILSGYKIHEWFTTYAVDYADFSGNYLPQEIRYKFVYRATERLTDTKETEYNAQSGGGFSNMEAVLRLSKTHETAPPDSTIWTPLLPSWYITYSTDASRKYEIDLSNQSADFVIYDE